MLSFVLMTFLVSWMLWIPLLWWLRSEGRLGVGGTEEPLSGMPIWVGVSWFVGASAPSLVALFLTARSGGWEAVTELLGRVVEWDVGLSWNLVAWFGPLVAGLAAVGVYAARGGSGVTPDVKRLPLIPVALAAALPFGPLGEELGWRGYLLERMLTNSGAVGAALIIGAVWTLWHVPVFWAPLGTSISGSRVTVGAVGRFWVEVTAASVIMTWLYVQTQGSLWIAVGFHAAWNADMHRFFFEPFSDDTGDQVVRWTTALFVVAALLLLLWPYLDWRDAAQWQVGGRLP